MNMNVKPSEILAMSILALALTGTLSGCAPGAMTTISHDFGHHTDYVPIKWPSINGCQPGSATMPCLVPASEKAMENMHISKNRNQVVIDAQHWSSLSSSQRHAMLQQRASAKAEDIQAGIAALPPGIGHESGAWLMAEGKVIRAKKHLPGSEYRSLLAQLNQK